MAAVAGVVMENGEDENADEEEVVAAGGSSSASALAALALSQFMHASPQWEALVPQLKHTAKSQPASVQQNHR